MEGAPSLKRGESFLPAQLKKRALSKTLFPPVMDAVRAKLGWDLKLERVIRFPKDYDIWNSMRVDYTFHDGDVEKPTLYVELETLDRAQLYNFLPHRTPARDESKLWHYCGILAKHLDVAERYQRPPRALIFLLVLPDERVNRYQIWDASPYCGFVDRSLTGLISQSPFRFYDPLIKGSARLFLEQPMELPDGTGRWRKRKLSELQGTCELVFITVTRTHLVVSRGRDDFSFEAEKRYRLRWAR